MLAAGLIGALIALLAGYGLLVGGFATDDAAADAARARIDTIQTTLDAVSRRLAAVESRPVSPDATARLADLATRLAALESAVSATGQRLTKAESALAAIPPAGAAAAPDSATADALDGLRRRLDALERAAAGAAATVSAPAILGDRVTVLETQTAVLSGRVDALADQTQALASRREGAEGSARAARALAIGTLRQAAARGGPFAADLGMVAAFLDDPALLDDLRPLAAKGAPTVATLAADLPAVSEAILAAGVAEPGGTLVDRLIARARGLVSVRPVGPIAGDSPPAIVSRMRAAVERGDLAAALDERKTLPAPEQTASAAWAAAAADRVAIDRLVDRLVAVLGTPSGAD
jgi:hypothetical protein